MAPLAGIVGAISRVITRERRGWSRPAMQRPCAVDITADPPRMLKLLACHGSAPASRRSEYSRSRNWRALCWRSTWVLKARAALGLSLRLRRALESHDGVLRSPCFGEDGTLLLGVDVGVWSRSFPGKPPVAFIHTTLQSPGCVDS